MDSPARESDSLDQAVESTTIASDREETVATCETLDGGDEFGGPFRLRYLGQCDREGFENVGILRDGVVGRWLRAIEGITFDSTRRYCSDVYIPRNDEQRARMLERINTTGPGYPGKFLLVCDEGDHIHIAHDCAYSNYQCRCFFARSDDFRSCVRKSFRRRRYLSEFDAFDWANIFIYFVMLKRSSNQQVWLAGRRFRLADKSEGIRWEHCSRELAKLLERQEKGDDGNRSSGQLFGETNTSTIFASTSTTAVKRSAAKSSGGPTTKKRKSKFERIAEKVSSLLETFYVIPASHLRDLLAADDETFELFDPQNDKAYYASCDVFSRRISKCRLSDLKEMYKDKLPVFYANSIDPFEYYHDIDESVNFIDNLLQFQFNDDEDEIHRFLTCVVRWFDLEGWDGNCKINAIAVIGPPNSGKNYFFDMFAALAYNVGHIGRVNNKTNNFALQECAGKRLVIGNEISLEEGAKEDMKKLCEGTAFNIRVKYQGDKIYTKAPVILISNDPGFSLSYDRAFEGVRLKTLRWRKCELLKDSKLKPYPLCIFSLLDKYCVFLK